MQGLRHLGYLDIRGIRVFWVFRVFRFQGFVCSDGHGFAPPSPVDVCFF